MKIDLIYGRTYFESFEKAICDLKENFSKDENYLFIVPDRFTLFTEKYIMEKLDLTSTFNIDVLTLNTLANRNCLINDYVDNETGTMLLSKVIFNIKNKLKVLKSTQTTFSEEMYALISQIKSSSVDSNDFLNCEFKGSDYEKLKKQDIALIYTTYEDYLKETGIDSVKKFEIFIEEIKNIPSVKESYIYMVGFESFTSQGYAIIENFIKYSKGVKISVINSINQQNFNLYPNDISNQIKYISKNLGLDYNINKDKISLYNENIIENLWAISSNKSKDKINIYEATTKIEQYRKICEIILSKIENEHLRFNDFNIIMNSADQNEKILTNVFDDFNISYFCDSSQTLSNFIVIKFICLVNECVLKNFDRLSFVEYSKSPFVEGSIEEKNAFEDFANQYSIRYGDFYKRKNSLEKSKNYDAFFEYSSKIAQKLLEYKKNFVFSNDTISNYINATRKLIEIFDLKNNFEKFLENYTNENKELQFKYGLKVFERLDTLLFNLDRVLGSTKVNFKEFVSILNSGLYATKIALVPQSVDSVYIGSIDTSFFLPKKYTFVVDCDNNTMPSLLKDNGVFTDEDIQNSNTKYKIDPQIRLLNKKIKLKVLSLFCLGDISLFYSTESSMEPSKIVKDLEKICILSKNKCEMENVHYLFSKNSLLDYLLNLKMHNIDILKSFNLLSDSIQKNIHKILLNNQQTDYLDNLKETLFLNNNFSITEIENFYKCPFKHFVEYGLKIKEKDSSDLSNLQIGNIIHEFCEDYIANNDFNTSNCIEISNQIFNKIMQKDEYLALKSNSKNEKLIKNLMIECEKLADALSYQIAFSEFKNRDLEKIFSCKFVDLLQLDNNEEIDQNLLNKIKLLNFTGKIDRLDFDNDDFIILDYKTGKTTMSYTDLYYGKKLQIYAYALAIEKLTKKHCIGAFYMPIKDNFSKSQDNKLERYKLDGIYLRDELKVQKIDKRLKSIYDNSLFYDTEFNVKKEMKSDILNVSFSKTSLAIKNSNNNLSNNEMDEIKNYGIKMIFNALKEILKGNIKILPIGDSNALSCAYCSYKGICKFDKFTKIRNLETISKSSLLGEFDSTEELNDCEE